MRPALPVMLPALVLAACVAAAQSPVMFETSVELVRLQVTVARGSDDFVTGLEASDFRIHENNSPQELAIFNRRSAPLTLVLLLDISASMTDRLPEVQEAASRFVRALAPEDLVQVAQFKDRVTVLQDFTSDRPALEAAIRRTEAVGATALHNALYGAIRTLYREQRPDEIRRQAIVVLSDGDDNASVVSGDQVLDFARRSEVAIYGIGLDPKMRDSSTATPALKLLTTLTRETGGTLLLPASMKDLEGVYGDIAAELRTQYSIGYASSIAVRDGQWRRISVRVPGRRGLEVRHRMGYYATRRSRVARGRLEGPGSSRRQPKVDAARGLPLGAAAPRSRGPSSVEGQDLAGIGDPEGVEPDPWMDIRDGILEMELAHEEADGADYGYLRVEPESRRFSWNGKPGSEACSRPVDRSFDDILSVSASKQAGFLVEFRPGTGETMHLVPAPYAAWLADRGLRRSDLPKELLVETRTAVASLLEALGRAPSAGQTALYAFYGTPVAVALADLFESPADYEGQAVRVKGDFEIVSRDRNQYGLYSSSQTVEASEDLEYTLSLTPTEDFALELSPVHELAAFVSSQANRWEDEGVEVAGVFRRLSALSGRRGRKPLFRVRFWDVTASEPAGPGASVIGRPTTLGELVAAEGKLDGGLVRVIGRFRGQNLYGDLPNASRRKSQDWVIKDGPSAVWVTGKPAAGSGWRLDPQSARDSVNWLQVVGRPKTRDGFVHLRAMEVIPSIAPSPDAMADPTRVQVRTYGAPVITFALPEAGERIAPETQFVIQFSNPMDPASLQGRVRLGYASPRAGDRKFEWLRVTYSDHTRHIVVDPGRPLLPGRRLQCQLLPGIVDAEGQPLGPRPGNEGDGAVEVLQFEVGR